jgi:hypothetical protein
MLNHLSRKINLDHIKTFVRPDFVLPYSTPDKAGFWNYYPKVRYFDVLSEELLNFFSSLTAVPKDGCLLFRGFPGTMLNIHSDGGGENAWALNIRLTNNEDSYMHWFYPLVTGQENTISPDNTKLSVTNFVEYKPHEVRHIYKSKIEKASVVKIGLPHSCSNEGDTDVVLLSIRFAILKNKEEFFKYTED